MPTLDIIIVNWNSGDQLYNCVLSIRNSLNVEIPTLNKIYIVDNNSTDKSLAKISGIDLPIEIIYNPKNMGFSYACNQGARKSNADYLLFLNPDTKLFANSLIEPIRFLEKEDNKEVGIVGIQLVDQENNIANSCSRFPRVSQYYMKMLGLKNLMSNVIPTQLMEDWDHQSTREVDQLIGAFLLVRNFIYKELDGFDERFFVYYEEVDFSYRAYKKGYKSVYLASAKAFHHGQGTTEQVKGKRLYYSLHSRIKYGYKHFNFFSATLLTFGTLFIEPFSRIFLAIAKRSKSDINAVLEGYILLWKNLIKAKTNLGGNK